LTVEHKTPEDLQNEQPFGQIPVLHDGDFKVYESRAIVRYIDDVITGGTELVPRDPRLKALVEQWVSVEANHFKSIEALCYELMFKKYRGLTTDAAVVEENRKKFHDFLAIFNTQLQGKNFLVGDHFTLADLVFMPYTEYLLRVDGWGDVFSAYPNVDHWWKNVSSRPSWQKVINLK